MALKIKNPRRSRLEPCPFDGGEARLMKDAVRTHLPHFVECKTCHARTGFARLQGAAVSQWNRRSK
jgi:Lar family restriction alleviation protein